ncbi:MAG: hypothetical protein Q9160_009276, partial [Pyrenula sp. 1 TL-2023]
SPRKNVCLFLDGLDEFDQQEDVKDLLDFVERLSKLNCVNVCLSSRPEAYLEKKLSHHKKLRLQDFTVKNLDTCIENELKILFKDYPPKDVSESDIGNISNLMFQKAGDVFLWVHFALNSLQAGFRYEDDFQTLRERAEELPSEIEQLYQTMWHRLHKDVKDEQPYREEATTYFSYHPFFPLSLFEMIVALDDDIRERYLQDLMPLNLRMVAQKCALLKTRILTRCASLVEVTINADTSSSYTGQPEILLNTKPGLARDGESSVPHDEQFAKRTEAKIAALLHRLIYFRGSICVDLVRDIGDHDTNFEVHLLRQLRRVCETLSKPRDSWTDITRAVFWHGGFLRPGPLDLTMRAA